VSRISDIEGFDEGNSCIRLITSYRQILETIGIVADFQYGYNAFFCALVEGVCRIFDLRARQSQTAMNQMRR
jgi:hypothetical protein